MDWRFSAHLLLLIIGLTAHTIAQQGEKQCPNNWVCPANVNCGNTTSCRCRTGYYQCIKKGVLLCRAIDTSTSQTGVTCSVYTPLPGETNCRNRICPVNKDYNPSYPCVPGYREDGFGACVDIHECRSKTHACGANSRCKNTEGGYYCICDDGYQKDNQTGFCPDKKNNVCTAIDTSTSQPGLTCPVYTLLPDETNCQNRICPVNKTYNPSYPCVPGYRDDGFGNCIDIHECNSKSHACGANTRCKNTDGGYYCICDDGYQKDNQTGFCPSDDKKKNVCTDIDECSNGRGKCASNQICRNIGGSYYCTCPEGYKNFSNICVEDPCAFNSSFLKEKENCDKSQDTGCMFWRATLQFLNSSCTYLTTEKPPEQLNNTINKLSNILSAQNNSFTADGTKTNDRVTDILKNVERLTLKSFIDQPRNQTITTTELNVSMQLAPDGCRFFALFLNDNLMKVPCPTTDQENDGAVFIVYKDLESSLNGKLSRPEDDAPVIYSRVVTGAVTGTLTENITFQLAHTSIQVLKPSQELTCVFWDPKKNDWSEDGCIKKSSESNNTHTTCSCNHLSSFALLLRLGKHESDPVEYIVSVIGLSLSIFCLLLTLLTFILCRSLRSAHTSVLTALCSCLFLGQILFLVGIRQTRNRLLCSIITGGLHFLFLCAFCWMSIESVLLFLTVRHLRAVNYMTSRRSNFPVMCLLGFGIPAVIVGISAAVQPRGYGTPYSCWLEPDSLIWSFLGPVAVIIITNTTLLVCTIVLLRKRLATLNTNVSTLKNSRSLTFKAMAQLFILGCTWGIGYFQFGTGARVISYIFIISNSLQGVYIFIVHCILNNQVRQEYRKLLDRAEKRSSDDSTPNTTSKSINLTEITRPMSGEKSSDKTVNWT